MSSEKGCFLAELTPGEAFGPGVFAVRDAQVNNTPGYRGPRVTMTLADATGRRKAKLWNASADLQRQIIQAELARVCGTVEGDDAGPYAREIRLDAFEAVGRSELDGLDDFLAPLPEDHDRTLRRLDRLLRVVRNPYLSALLSRFFDMNDAKAAAFRRRFETATAAKTHHHAWPGGLLRHSVEVAELCECACDVLEFLHQDFLICAALLHDIGKVYEMRHDLKSGDYTEIGILVGHVEDGCARVAAAAASIPGFPLSLKIALRHALLSHHEQPEWGAAKRPAFAEAFVLALSDRISAHATECHDAALNALPHQLSIRRGDREIFVGNLGRTEWGDPMPSPGGVMPGSSRGMGASIFAVAGGGMARRLPLLGMAAAGPGDLGSDGAVLEEREVILPAGGADFLLRVTGDSMTLAGICGGDLIFVRRQERAEDGQIVVAYIPGSGPVVKRYKCSGTEAFLVSESHREYPPLPVDAETRIQGCVSGVFRDYTA